MNNHDLRKKHLRGEWLLTTALAVLLLAVLGFADLARPLGNVLYDHLMRLQGFRHTQNIVIIAIDDRSIQDLGGWPLQRHQYSKFLEQLNDDCCRPKAIGIDLLFLDHTEEDNRLATQLKKHNSVLPLAFKVPEQNSLSLQPIPPVSPIAEAVQLAHINLSFDTDGVIRAFHTQEQSWVHFSLAMDGRAKLHSSNPAQDQKFSRFRMVDPRVGFPMISFADAIQSSASRSLLKDKYVLIGVTAPSLGDRYPTLYSGKNNASTPGVAILASVLNASINDSLIEEAKPLIVFCVMLIPLLLMLQSLLLLSPRQALVLAGGLTLGALATSYVLLSTFDYWIDPVPFILIAILIQPLWAWRRLEAIVHFVQDKAADLRLLQATSRTHQEPHPSREVVLQHAKLLDHAVASARSELGFLAAIVDEMPDSVMIFDEQDALLLCNQKIKQLFTSYHFQTGCKLAEVITHLGFANSTQSSLEKLEQSAQTQSVLQLETTSGKRHFIVKTVKVDSPLGNNIRLIILMDVTELRQSQTQRDRALQFLSHDMRTPVASILSITSQSRSNSSESGSKITHHAKALLNMMDDFILTISAEASHYNVQQVLLDNLINDAIGEVVDLANARSISIKDETDASDIFVTVNARLLMRALINLMFNAVKFSPPQTSIHIQTTHKQNDTNIESEHVVITILNQVIDTPQTTDLTPSMSGFGLGLDFVDNVIHKHQGLIERNIPQNGLATVKILLPCESSKSTDHVYK